MQGRKIKVRLCYNSNLCRPAWHSSNHHINQNKVKLTLIHPYPKGRKAVTANSSPHCRADPKISPPPALEAK